MEKQQQNNALSDFVLRMVSKTEDGYALHPNASGAFTVALDALFESGKLDPKAEVEMLLRLGWLFESKHAFGVADGIVRLLAQDDRTLSILGISSGAKTRELKKRFAQFEGDGAKVVAPVFGEGAPEGSLKVSSFLEPGREMGRGKKPSKKVESRAPSPTPRRRFKT
jgi:hypothetical protein